MSRSYAAIVGGAAGGLALVVIVIGLVWFCIKCQNSKKNSETGSSDPSALGRVSFELAMKNLGRAMHVWIISSHVLLKFSVEWNRGAESSSAGGLPLSALQGAKQFTLEELEQATKQFSASNLIGQGSFGLVYKGLLGDGTLIAIKRRSGASRQEFVEEVLLFSSLIFYILSAL